MIIKRVTTTNDRLQFETFYGKNTICRSLQECVVSVTHQGPISDVKQKILLSKFLN